MMEKVSLSDSTSSTGCEVLGGEEIHCISLKELQVRYWEGGREGGREGCTCGCSCKVC